MNPSWKKTPVDSTVRFMSRASASEMASGFSQKMALPACAAARVTAPCVSVGVTMTTASTEGSLITTAGSVDATGTSYCAATSSTASCDRSAMPASRVQAIRVERSRA